MSVLDKQISLGGKSAGGKKAKGRGAYPTKTTINLVQSEGASGSLAARIISVLAVIALVCIFGKFLVADPLSQMFASTRQVEAARAELSELTAKNADYTELQEKYAHYIVSDLTDEESVMVDRDTVVNMIQTTLSSGGTLTAVTVSNNVLTATIGTDDLATISRIVSTLESNELVAHVTVSTAQGTDTALTGTVQVTFADAGTVAEGGANAS